MELLWTPLLLVVVCLSEVLGSPGTDAGVNISRPVHILEDQSLMVLTPAGLIQTLNETRFLMVIFREYIRLWQWRAMLVSLIWGMAGVLHVIRCIESQKNTVGTHSQRKACPHKNTKLRSLNWFYHSGRPSSSLDLWPMPLAPAFTFLITLIATNMNKSKYPNTSLDASRDFVL